MNSNELTFSWGLPSTGRRLLTSKFELKIKKAKERKKNNSKVNWEKTVHLRSTENMDPL